MYYIFSVVLCFELEVSPFDPMCRWLSDVVSSFLALCHMLAFLSYSLVVCSLLRDFDQSNILWYGMKFAPITGIAHLKSHCYATDINPYVLWFLCSRWYALKKTTLENEPESRKAVFEMFYDWFESLAPRWDTLSSQFLQWFNDHLPAFYFLTSTGTRRWCLSAVFAHDSIYVLLSFQGSIIINSINLVWMNHVILGSVFRSQVACSSQWGARRRGQLAFTWKWPVWPIGLRHSTCSLSATWLKSNLPLGCFFVESKYYSRSLHILAVVCIESLRKGCCWWWSAEHASGAFTLHASLSRTDVLVRMARKLVNLNHRSGNKFCVF